MSAMDKGRFCASCQKAVIDFTSMSDRQLAEFFKKPVSSTCGRFQPEQLDRDIIIERKRIPWIKYFFQFTLPVFTLALKSSGMKERTTGKVKTEVVSIPASHSPIAGKVLSLREIKTDTLITETLGTPRIHLAEVPKDLTRKRTNSISLDFLDSSQTDLNKIPEIKPESISQKNIVMEAPLTGIAGGLIVCVRADSPFSKFKKVADTILNKVQGISAKEKFSVYPNPVQRNSSLKLDFKKLDAGEYTISIISMSGEVVQTKELSLESRKQLTELTLKNIAAGTYFVHVFNRKTGASYSEKIIVQ